MVTMLGQGIGSRDTARWVPWLLAPVVALYLVGYVDGTVHGAVLGAAGLPLNYVHEFFHHARHVALMCH